MATWPDIVDSAVKIGLGAAIGAGGAVILALVNRKSEAIKERRLRRMDLVAESVKKFEESATAYLEYYSLYGGYLHILELNSTKGVKVAEAAAFTSALKKTEEEHWDKMMEFSSTKIRQAALALHQAEALLLLAGVPGSEKLMREYRGVTCLIKVRRSNDILGGDPPPSIEEWDKIGDKLWAARGAFYGQIAKDFAEF